MANCSTPKCCCPPCYARSKCSQGAGFNPCCSCLPLRLCVDLFTDEVGCICAGTLYTPVASDQFVLDCSLPEVTWSGSLICANAPNSPIDITIGFLKIDGDCYVYLASVCLGYVDSPGYDTRLILPMGGPYHDDDARRARCVDFSFDFDVDLSNCLPTCNAATISVSRDSLICRGSDRVGVNLSPCSYAFDSCLYDRVCIQYEESYGYEGTIEEVKVCITKNDYGDFWEATFNGVTITITPSPDNLKELTLIITEGTPEQSVQIIEYCDEFKVSWIIDDGSIVTIIGDQHAGCSDCKCVCESLCVTIFNETNPTTAIRGLATWDEVCLRWVGVGETFWTSCDFCTGITTLRSSVSIHFIEDLLECPDITVNSNFDSGEDVYSIYIDCEKCIDCDLPTDISNVCTCNSVPIELTATIENVTDCACADAGTAQLYYNFDPIDPAWKGVFKNLCGLGDVIVVLKCDGGNCSANSGCERFQLQVDCSAGIGCASVGCTCDPFELLFEGIGGGCANCDDPVGANFDVRITA